MADPKGRWTGNSAYRPEMCQEILELYENGESDAEVAYALGISKRTFYTWIKDKPEFAHAVEDGKMISECWWQKLGRAGAAGKVDIQARVWLANMKNRFGWVESEKSDTTSTVNITLHEDTLKGLK